LPPVKLTIIELDLFGEIAVDRKQYWENIYSAKKSDSVSWFQEHADTSLRLIHNTGLGKDAAIIDAGGGSSNLVDDLVAEGYTDVTVNDLSSAALAAAKRRLGKHAYAVHWIEGDITRLDFPIHRFDIWHDRAVFHFLTDPADRQAYVKQVMRAVRPGGHVIVATFAEDGPKTCSGLPVMRYKPDALHDEFGDAFLLVKHEKEAHHTPSGSVQQFVYCYCRKSNS
jgi:ubiquinone/menaquinone biosynthesis C-methylase UbiE